MKKYFSKGEKYFFAWIIIRIKLFNINNKNNYQYQKLENFNLIQKIFGLNMI